MFCSKPNMRLVSSIIKKNNMINQFKINKNMSYSTYKNEIEKKINTENNEDKIKCLFGGLKMAILVGFMVSIHRVNKEYEKKKKRWEEQIQRYREARYANYD